MFVCINLFMCMHASAPTRVCVCKCAFMHVCVWQPLVLGLTSTVWDRLSLLSPAVYASLSDFWGYSYSHLHPTVGLQSAVLHPAFQGFWGLELRPSCFHGRPHGSQLVLSAPALAFKWLLVLGSHWTWKLPTWAEWLNAKIRSGGIPGQPEKTRKK